MLVHRGSLPRNLLGFQTNALTICRRVPPNLGISQRYKGVFSCVSFDPFMSTVVMVITSNLSLHLHFSVRRQIKLYTLLSRFKLKLLITTKFPLKPLSVRHRQFPY